eukprot:CAMPEP_0184508826 /NCGR_PEP_ID=MMETSP0198_2-20121128/962_1 /TAXON_ID=1112570 /ORGANISM="Thraustochytrium sp., Strain LLF1b" /LENGTH=173 /DNA_ID=CAMNT_0026898625 /DNA_START=187 /DNA_END=708 /DNA_ORIENTATION=+
MLAHDDATPVLPQDVEHNTHSGQLLKRGYKYRAAPCFGVEWKERFLVLRGKYLFRHATASSKKIKGVPLDLESFTISTEDEEYDDLGQIIPFAFKLSSIGKEYLFAVPTAAERLDWINAMTAAKERAIKQRLGHAETPSWEKSTNRLGEKLVQQKSRAEEVEASLKNGQPMPY